MKSVTVQRSSRLIDLASIALLCAGAALYVFAYFGMEELRTRPHEAFVPGQTVPFARTREHARLSRISTLGLAVAGLGMVVGVSAAAHAKVLARRG